LFVGVCAVLILTWTKGKVEVPLVLFSINVFLSLALTKLGLCRHWWRTRNDNTAWPIRFCLAMTAFAITTGIQSLPMAYEAEMSVFPTAYEAEI
jgi:uncharacterized membrane protein